MKIDNFKGMDNRHRAEDLPEGVMRNAVNVLFDDAGRVKRVQGATKVYAGTDIHSYWQGYFVEGNQLKRLNSDNSAKTLATVGSHRAGFVRIGERVYVGNGTGFVIEGDQVKSLGITPPAQQPVLVARETGGLFAGDYQVAITFMRDGEESGCGTASRVTVSDGGGIYFSMPTVPADVDTVAVYVSSVNGDDLYLYDEVDASATEVFIDSHQSTIRLETQFLYPPALTEILAAHNGRLYWADGDLLRYSEPQAYVYTKAGNWARFGADISLIVALPGALYVCADKTYRIVNIDGEGFMQRIEVLPYGAVKGALHYDQRGESAIWQSHNGFVIANSEGLTELVADTIALPQYNNGTLTVAELDGIRQLIAVSQGGVPSSLMDKDFKAAEITRKGSAL
jgi:hypothetical protein